MPASGWVKRTDTVELRREDFQHDQCKAELSKTRSNVGSLEGALSGADLDQLLR